MSIMTRVLIYHLEMTDKANLRPSSRSHPQAIIQRAEVPNPEFNRFLYSAVGGEWHWHERLSWTYERWMQWLDRDEQETWVAYVRGTPAGYVELEKQPNGSVEIAYFGLLPQFIGQGLGGQLLTFGIQRGWDLSANRSALRNYQARGLQLFKQEEKWVLLPGETPGPWPNAQRAPYSITPNE
jgi:GNAT superfamily N-acetyltransferase